MSSTYRDDNTDGAQAVEKTWGGLSEIVGEVVVAAEKLIFGLMILHGGGNAVAADSVSGSVGTLVQERVTASSSAPSHLHASNVVSESARATDKAVTALRVLHADAATLADMVVINSAGRVSEDTFTAADQVTSSRYANNTVSETAKATDAALQAAKTVVLETAAGGDEIITVSVTAGDHADNAEAGDAVIGTLHARSDLHEAVQGHSSVTQHVGAVGTVQDWADVWDRILQANSGQAWTANAGTWAMSRYAPFDFTSLAVINGVICATGEDGVYALDGEDETITATLTTGQMDVGKGQLAHLTDAYLAYELDGSASMTVGQTQGGAAESYSYSLPAKPADTLTTGRFQFGRGLRGRHFTFSLSLTGKAGYINDLRVSALPVKRRV
jgi:hypothetical protein